MSADDKAAAAWDDYINQQQQEKIEELERELNAAHESFRKLNIHTLNLVDRIRRLEEALHRIANQDYRGNRSTESQIAFDALKESKP